MRAAALVLCGLLALASVADAKGLIVRAPLRANNTAGQYEWQRQLVAGLLDRRNANYTIVPSTAVRESDLRLGRVRWGWNGTTERQVEQFDWVMILHWDLAQAFCAGLDSITKVSGWPTVPFVLVGAPTWQSETAQWANTANCTTGVTTPNVSTGGFPTHAIYRVGGTEVWRFNTSTWRPMIRTASAGIWRPLIGLAVAAAGRPGGFTAPDPDSCGRLNAPDTVLAWGRYRSATDTAPIFGVQMGGVTPLDPMPLDCVLALTDSVTGGKVFDSANHKPIRFSFVVRKAMSTDHWRFPTDRDRGGMFCRSDSCDSNNVKAVVQESLLTIPGLKVTYFVDPESIPAFASRIGWFKKLPGASFGLEGTSGLATNGHGGTVGKTVASTATNCIDPFGEQRTRTFSVPSNCLADTSSVYCRLVNGFATIKTHVGEGRVDRAVFPQFSDWSPKVITRAKRDSAFYLPYVIWKAGVRTILIDPMWQNANEGQSWTRSGPTFHVGVFAPAADPHGLSMQAQVYDIPKTPPTDYTPVGQLKTVAVRQLETAIGNFYGRKWSNTAHDVRIQGLGGAITRRWYFDTPGLPYWIHNFENATPVLELTLGSLGGDGGPTPYMPGWWLLRSNAKAMMAVNAFMPPGKRAWAFSKVEDLEP